MNQEQEIRIGNLVVLNTGNSPKMLVEEMEGDIMHCVWFDKEEKLGRSQFNKAILSLAMTSGLTSYVARTKPIVDA